MQLHELISVTDYNEVGTYIAEVDITDIEGERYTAEYVARPDDGFGLAPSVYAAILQWIGDGKTVHPYVQPAVAALEVDRERDRRTEGGFTFNGVSFQSRKQDRENIAGASTAALAAIMNGAMQGDLRWADPSTDFAWIAEDNTIHTMDAHTMFALGQAAMAHKQAHIFAARTIKNMDPIPQNYADDQYWP